MKKISCIILALLLLSCTAFAEDGAGNPETAVAENGAAAAETVTETVPETETAPETADAAQAVTEMADAQAPDQMDILTGTPDLKELTPVEGTDTTYLVVETGGIQETVAQSVFTQKQLGFTFQYDSDYLSVYDTVSEDGKTGAVYVNPSDPENKDLISIQIVSASSLGISPEAYLEQVPMAFALDDVGQMDQIVLDSGVAFSFRAGFKGGMYYMFFTLTGGQEDLCLLVQYPLSVIEDYGARFDRLIWSISFTD